MSSSYHCFHATKNLYNRKLHKIADSLYSCPNKDMPVSIAKSLWLMYWEVQGIEVI